MNSSQVRPYFVSITCSLLTLFFGPLMPFLQWGDYQTKYINLVWNAFYGVGFYVTYLTFDYHAMKQGLGFIGFILWPLFLVTGIFFAAKEVVSKPWPYSWKIVLTLFFILSLTFNISIKDSQDSRFKWIPFYETFSNIGY